MIFIALVFILAAICITISVRDWNRTCAEAKRKLEAERNRPVEGLTILRRPLDTCPEHRV